MPIITIDTKKKELVGNFKNAGRVWSQTATPVNDHHSRSEGQGIAIPFGVYAPIRNRGSVFVGRSQDTPQFAADNIARWWRQCGQRQYPEADHLLILAGSGGSNGARVRMWNWALQKQVADLFGLTITVSHFPTGASEWNPIEHRAFSEISKHWAGQPLDSYEIIVDLISSTSAQTGLHVRSQLVRKYCPTQCKVTEAEFKTIHLAPHAVVPGRDYAIFQTEKRN